MKNFFYMYMYIYIYIYYIYKHLSIYLKNNILCIRYHQFIHNILKSHKNLILMHDVQVRNALPFLFCNHINVYVSDRTLKFKIQIQMKKVLKDVIGTILHHFTIHPFLVESTYSSINAFDFWNRLLFFGIDLGLFGFNIDCFV